MGDALGSALLGVYGFAGRIFIPAIPSILGARARRGHEDPSRTRERYGDASAARPAGRLVWVHAASVGEVTAAAPLVRHLTGRGRPVLVTTVTVTGAATVARLLPAVIHQYAPVDVRPWVRRFLRHWHPDLALFVESEIWPVMVDELHEAETPHVIVNGRLSEKSFRRWRSIGGAARRVFGRITRVLAQSDADARRFAALGATAVEVSGNLKFDVPPPASDPKASAALRDAIGDRPIWLAASTHPGEEAIAAEVHKRLRASGTDIVTAIVPRHPERGPEVAAEMGTLGLEPWLKSRGKLMPGNPSILIIDTLGELGTLYSIAPVAFVGGSLVERGGQNPIEPARLRSAILHGPLTANFADVYDALDGAGGATKVIGVDDLAREVRRLVSDADARRLQIEAATRVVDQLSGALDRTIAALALYLERAAATL